VMWFWPFSIQGYALGTEISLTTFALIKLWLFSIPMFYLFYLYLSEKEGPYELIDYMKERFGDILTYVTLGVFAMLIIYFGLIGYIIKIL
jgi:hypothetical protein